MSIIILVLSFASSILAICGNTWDEGAQKISSKITLRGRLAILLFLLTLIVAIAKDRSDSQEASRKNDDIKNLIKRNKAQSIQLSKLEVDNKNLVSLSENHKDGLQTLRSENTRLTDELIGFRENVEEHQTRDTDYLYRLERREKTKELEEWKKKAPPEYLYQKEGYEGRVKNPDYQRYRRKNPPPGEDNSSIDLDWRYQDY